MKTLPRISFLMAAAAVYAGSSVLAAEKLRVDFNQAQGATEFKATGRPSALKIVGKASAPKGELVWEGKSVSGALTLDLESLDTGISLRNNHMKEKYLETGKFKEAKLVIAKLEVPNSAQDAAFVVDQLPFQGILSLHGQEKPVRGTARVEKKDQSLIVNAEFGLKLTEYAVAIPTFAGITVADDVQVTVQATSPLVK